MKVKKTTYTTPLGDVIYNHLVEPSTEFQALGTYDLTLALEADEAQTLIDLIATAQKDNLTELAKTKKGHIKEADLPYKPEYDKEGNETGRLLFRFSQKAAYISKEGKKYTFNIVIFDAANKVIHPKSIGRGTKLKAAFQLHPWFAPAGAGVSLRLKAVQIIEYQEYLGASAEAYGFSEEENGYVAEDAADVTYEDDDATNIDSEGNEADF